MPRYPLPMRKTVLSIALFVAFAGAIAFSAFGDFARPPAFRGCFDYEGRKLVLSQGRLMIDGADAGSFRHSLGDATKGPDSIHPNASPTILKSIGLNPRQVWFVTDKGIQLPLENGDYRTAAPCRA